MNVNLVLLKKDGTTKSFVLPSSVTSIGRRQDCDFCLPLSMISRKHCELSLDRGQVCIRDFGSRNGTFLNGQRIEEARANAGDLLQIGPVKFVIQIDGQPVSFENFLPTQDEHALKTDVHTAFDDSSHGSGVHSETTEILESLPDDFDIESSLDDELSKEK
jgi:pSer/pThr/pTyr-binding forkhead associated (FHA) protein